jgi:hypothetical protein
MTGHSVAELENMSEEELRKMAMQMMSTGTGNMPTKATDAGALIEAQNDINKINERWLDLDRLCRKETEEIADKIEGLYVKYQKQIDAVPMSGMAFGVEPVYLESEIQQIESLKRQRDTECFTLWRAHIAKMQGRIKSKMADVKRYDEAYATTLSSSGMTSTAKVAPSSGLTVAEQYINCAKEVTSLPKK